VKDLDEVIAVLENIDQSLPAQDGVACFNRMYLTVTQLVRGRLADGFFADAARMQALDLTFAGLYLDAVAADTSGAAVPTAWAPLFARRHDSRVAPIQFAVAGMNAHINHDLPVAVAASCEAAHADPDSGSFHGDYLRINQLLAETEQQVRESFMSGLMLQVDQQASPVLDVISTWSIDRARDAAWVNANVLWHLLHLGPVHDAFADTLAGTVGLVTAALLAPVSLPAATPRPGCPPLSDASVP
jgi:hypothetical protein